MVDDTTARRTCVRCGETYERSIEVCPICDIWIESGDPFQVAPPVLTFDLVLALVLPLAGPLAYYLVTPESRSDLAELAGLLLWPAVYCAIGAFFVSRTHEKLKSEAPDWTRPSVFLRLYKWLSNIGLAMLAVFEAATVIAASEWRWGPEHKETAIGVSWVAAGFYVTYAVCTILAAYAKRHAVIEIDARSQERAPSPDGESA